MLISSFWNYAALSLSLCKTNFNILIIIRNDAFTSNKRKWLLPLLRIPFYDLIFLFTFLYVFTNILSTFGQYPVVKTRKEEKKKLWCSHDPTTLPEELHDMRNTNNVTKYFVPLERSHFVPIFYPFFPFARFSLIIHFSVCRKNIGDISKYRRAMKTGTIIRFSLPRKRNYRNEIYDYSK